MIYSLILILFVSISDQTPQDPGYECEYLQSHKELVCHCTRENINIRHVSMLTRGSGRLDQGIFLELKGLTMH